MKKERPIYRKWAGTKKKKWGQSFVWQMSSGRLARSRWQDKPVPDCPLWEPVCGRSTEEKEDGAFQHQTSLCLGEQLRALWGLNPPAGSSGVHRSCIQEWTPQARLTLNHMGAPIKLPGPDNILHALENLLKWMILQVSGSNVHNQQPFFQRPVLPPLPHYWFTVQLSKLQACRRAVDPVKQHETQHRPWTFWGNPQC